MWGKGEVQGKEGKQKETETVFTFATTAAACI